MGQLWDTRDTKTAFFEEFCGTKRERETKLKRLISLYFFWRG